MSIYEESFDEKLFDMLYDTPEMILLLKNRYQTPKVWKFCIEREPSLFGQMENPTEDIAIYALDVCGENIIPLVNKFDYIPVTKKMAFTALRSYPGAILYIPQNILCEEMFNMAFNSQPSLLGAYDNLGNDYLLRRVRERPSDIRYINNPSEELKYAALEKDPNVCVYIDNLTPQMISLLYDLKPGLAEMYTNTLERENMLYAEDTKTTEADCKEWSNSY